MDESEHGMVIVVGVDGSDGSRRALEWCAEMAPRLDAEVVAVHALSIPMASIPVYEAPSPPVVDQQWHDELEATLADEWCRPLTGVPHRSLVIEGTPSRVILDVAEKEGAGLIVVGSRGRGGFTELLLGSVGHQLSHHTDRPLVIVPPDRH